MFLLATAVPGTAALILPAVPGMMSAAVMAAGSVRVVGEIPRQKILYRLAGIPRYAAVEPDPRLV